MKTVFMAGGKGTRISSLFSNIPKPMINIAGKPVLEHEINCLREQGFTDIIITVSHLAEEIINYFGDGSKYGVAIEYYVEPEPLGNAGALFKIRDKLDSDFLLLNADALFDIDFNRFVNYHKAKNAWITLFTHPNTHPYDSSIIIANLEGSVDCWLAKEDEKPQWYRNRINAGLHIINPIILDMLIEDISQDGYNSGMFTQKVDLDRQVLKPFCGTGKMFCYDSPEYVRDMGTPDRYEAVCKDFNNGIVKTKNLNKKQRAVFLDRDGTINKYVGFLRDINDFELIPGVAEAIRKINALGYLAIVATNQPVIARGDTTVIELQEIHHKMETLLGKAGAYVDAIYYCPHHPDKGYPGEISEYKIDCDCRKPKPGMLFKAAEEYNIDLSSSWMIGDSESDIIAGKTAGCKTVLIGTEDYGQDITVSSLKNWSDSLGIEF